MPEEPEVDEPQVSEPESEEHQIVTAITLIRIYDVLMGIYGKLDPERADLMENLHRNGKVLSSEPYIDEFIADPQRIAGLLRGTSVEIDDDLEIQGENNHIDTGLRSKYSR